ncbi:hypothetical protein [uncultured Bacteroides sp.]|uniref:HYC_CC_PP family protein n=1 Tax=uncultured Bacteroides sp. TaxID=162156 RepID=UPI002AA76D15|nr:hypothetical protein [uncultured Bacteroides sp.]
MKKYLLLLLMPLYIGVSSGITLNYHYCMGKLAEVSLWRDAACPVCGMKHAAHKCCATETQLIKLSLDQDVAHAAIHHFTPSVTTLLFDKAEWCALLIPESHVITYVAEKYPPDCNSVPLFIHNCTFLI